MPVGQQEQLFGVSMSEDACNGTHGPGQLETVSDITITTACSDDGPSSSHNGGTNIPAMSTPNTAIGSSHANSDLVAICDLVATSSISNSGFSQHVGPTISLPESAKPVDYFMAYFDDDLLQHIVEQIILYAWYDTTTNKIKAFLGLIIMMGIKRLPLYTDYWSSNALLGTPELVAGFPLNRFRHLLTHIHFNNNNNAPPQGSTAYDKLYKLRPILTAIHEKCLKLYDPHRENSIDEAMVGFKGRSTLKQYTCMPIKPTKRGFKVCCRCDATNGYTCSFQVYTGKDVGAVQNDLGSRVVYAVSETILDKDYHLYFDNFFL